MKRACATALSFSLSFLSASALAQRPTVSNLQVVGDGCTGVSETLTDQGGGNFVYGLVLPQFDAATVIPEFDNASKFCALSVKVKPAPGYQFKITRLLLQGRHDGPRNVTRTQVSGHYRTQFLNGNGSPNMQFDVQTNAPIRNWNMEGMRIVQADGIGQTPGNWTLVIDDKMNSWSPCGEDVELQGSLQVDANSNDGQTDAEIALQRSDAATSRSLGWGWQFRRCAGGGNGGGDGHPTPGYAGSWRSHYQALNGQTVAAALDLQGERGTYRVGPLLGQLYNLRRQGRTIVGNWQAGGTRGWLRFDLSQDGRSFTGRYGVGNSQQVRGQWWGQR